MLRLNDILDKVAAYHPAADLDLIKKAYVYSAKVHQGQIRKSGEPYLVHPLEVAGILAELRLDEASIVTGLLHDTIEDTLATREEIAELFGEEVADLVDGVTKLSQFSAGNTKVEKQAENFRKMVVAMAKDIRVLLVKLADRIHNMRTLEHMAPEKQDRIAQETLDIYAPLSNRLGMQSVKSELEDLSFKYLKPSEHGELQERLAEQGQGARPLRRGGGPAHPGAPRRERDPGKGLRPGQAPLFHLAQDARGGPALRADPRPGGLPGHRGLGGPVLRGPRAHPLPVEAHPGPVQGLHRHPQAEPLPVAPHHRGGAAGRAHRDPDPHRGHAPGRRGGRGRPLEVQGDPRDGKGKPGVRASDADQFGWLRQLLEWQKELSDPTEFLETVKVDLFADEVFVFTPKGDVKSLPRGATPLDFAYSVHSEIGHSCVGAKVNGKIVPLRYRLKNGDTIEILTSPHAQPSKDWLTFVRTSRAQARIRQYIRQAEHRRSLEIGKEVAERELRRYGVSLSRSQKDGSLDKAAASLGYRIGDDVLVAIGYGKVAPDQLLRLLVSEDKLASPDEPGVTSRLTEIFRKVARRPAGGVRISGIEDILVRYGKCCNPVPGDPIVGFITRGRGVTVHTARCEKGLSMDPLRRVDVSWDVKGELKRLVSVKVVSDDRPGMLARISQIFSEAGVNIAQADVRSGAERAVLSFEVSVQDLKQLTAVMRSLEKVEGVHSVERV